MSTIEKTTKYQTDDKLGFSPSMAFDNSAALLSKQTSVVPPSMAPLDSRRSLLLKWIPILYKGGATPFFVQRHVEVLSKVLDLSVSTTYIPGRVLLTWGESSTHKGEYSDSLFYQPTALTLRVSWGFRVEMLEHMNNRLAELEKHINSPPYSIEELHIFIDNAAASLPVYNNWVVLLAFGILSGSMAPAFFGGNYWDGLCAFFLGTLAGAFAIISDYFPASFLFMHEAVCSFTCSLLSILACIAFPAANLHYWPIVLASTIWILPGFSMVIGFMDVVTKFPITGFIMHLSGLFIGLLMGVGYASSVVLLNLVFKVEIPDLLIRGTGLPPAMRYTLSAVFSAACCVIFQASPRQIPLIIFSVLICFAMMESMDFKDPATHGIIAFFLGLIVRSCSGMLSQLPEASIYVAMLPLVPGSKIVRSSFNVLDYIHKVRYTVESDKAFFPPQVESVFVCIVVAVGLVGADVFFNRFLMKFIVRPFLGPYVLFPIKRALFPPHVVSRIESFLDSFESILLFREKPNYGTSTQVSVQNPPTVITTKASQTLPSGAVIFVNDINQLPIDETSQPYIASTPAYTSQSIV